MWGRDVLRELRKDPANRLTPVVIITADAYAERMEELWREGASGYITKPYRVATLLSVIDRRLAQRQDDSGRCRVGSDITN